MSCVSQVKLLVARAIARLRASSQSHLPTGRQVARLTTKKPPAQPGERVISSHVFPAGNESDSRLGFNAFIRQLKATLEIEDARPFFQGKSLLDVGCGSGSDVLRFKDFGAEALGLDLHPFRREGYIIEGNATRMPFSNDAFDIVFAKYFIDQLSPADLTAFLEESFRVLKPGGLLYIFGIIDASEAKTIGNFKAFHPLQPKKSIVILQKPATPIVIKQTP